MLDTLRAKLLILGQSALSAVIGLVAVLLLEWAVVGWEKCSLKKLLAPSASLKRDLISYFLDVTGGLRITGNLVALGSALYFGSWFRDHLGLNLLQSIPSIIAQNLALILLIGFVEYWMHRMMHTFPWMWEIHRFHHSATEMSVFTARRDSILTVPLGTFFHAVPFTLLGTPAEYPIFAGLISAHAMFIHSEIPWDLGWFGRWILISPYAHRIHHSIDEKHFNRNYAFLLPVWDQVFGTYYAPRDPAPAVGIRGDQYNQISYLKGMAMGIKWTVGALKKPSTGSHETRTSTP